jgi:hypothetical protein
MAATLTANYKFSLNGVKAIATAIEAKGKHKVNDIVRWWMTEVFVDEKKEANPSTCSFFAEYLLTNFGPPEKVSNIPTKGHLVGRCFLNAQAVSLETSSALCFGLALEPQGILGVFDWVVPHCSISATARYTRHS